MLSTWYHRRIEHNNSLHLDYLTLQHLLVTVSLVCTSTTYMYCHLERITENEMTKRVLYVHRSVVNVVGA